jgi:hypothetical protein
MATNNRVCAYRTSDESRVCSDPEIINTVSQEGW